MVDRVGSGQLRPVVMDFGLARDRSTETASGLTQSGAVMGTPAYMSPEQARGEARRLDRRSDVYSLGATLYDLLAGEPPFQDETVVNIILKVLNDTPRPLRSYNPDIAEAIEVVVNKCLNKEAEQRYPTALALAEDLERYLSTQRVSARRLSLSYRIRYFARRNRGLSALAVALFLSLMSLGAFGIYTHAVNLRKERLAQQQAELQKRLGQEITTMEWMLRSARQLPLHDLGREKVIIRARMTQLESEMAGYGEVGRGLAHYALGRGHMALHEYSQALVLLQQAVKEGNEGAEVQYALGFVLGKHFEQAMYEARLSGGGDWAQKQLKEIEPKYLAPAIAALQRSRAMKSDTPSYLEALIAYYKRDYPTALKQAAIALQKVPWLYEASKLAGDVHLERALQARDGGRNEEAEQEFTAAVSSFTDAASVGQSDGEVYEGLAEAWVRQIEMATSRGQRAEAAYAAALAASTKIATAEPESISGPLKRAIATMMTMAVSSTGLSSQEGVRQCLSSVAAVLQKEPGHPYARDTAAGCYCRAAEDASARGENPEPFFREALKMLEPAVSKFPQFLWGLNDLGNIYQTYGVYLRLTGQPTARDYLDKSIQYLMAAEALDSTYLKAPPNLLGALSEIVLLAKSAKDLQSILKQADENFATCQKISLTSTQCYNNYVQIYARAARRIFRSGKDPQVPIDRALTNLVVMRKLGGIYIDAEQSDALARLVDSASRVRRNQDPTPALTELQAALLRCFALATQDAMCRTIAAEAAWVIADWRTQQKKPFISLLTEALAKAKLATQSPETYPDAWQVLAETNRRLALTEAALPAAQEQHLAAGIAAVEKVFAINPNHALGWATKGALELDRAHSLKVPAARRAAAQSAVTALERALQNDPFLAYDYAPLLAQAQKLSAP